jgi:hypothetical protein
MLLMDYVGYRSFAKGKKSLYENSYAGGKHGTRGSFHFKVSGKCRAGCAFECHKYSRGCEDEMWSRAKGRRSF